jgi:nucleoid-associated protein YgaU
MEKIKAESEKNRLAAEAAEKREAALRKQESEKRQQELIENVQRKRAETAAAEAAAAAAVKHVWTKEDTYAGLAQKHYGSIKEPYWRLIYNHNKEIIGDHPNDIRVGLEIEIPPLPEELKKK